MPDERAVPNADPRRAEGVEDSNVERAEAANGAEREGLIALLDSYREAVINAWEDVPLARTNEAADRLHEAEDAAREAVLAALLRTPAPAEAVAAGDSGPVGEARRRLIEEAREEAAYYESQRAAVAGHDAVRANIEAGTASLLIRLADSLSAQPAAPPPSSRDREIRQKIRRLWNDFLWNGGWPERPRIDYGEFSAMCDAIADFVLRDCAPLLRTPVPAGAAADDDVAAEKPVAVGEAATITSDHLRDLERAAAWLEDTQDMVLLPRSLRELKAALSSSTRTPEPGASDV